MPRDKSKRNSLIFELYQDGKSPASLGKRFDISSQRVMEIVNKISRDTGLEKRKRIYPGPVAIVVSRRIDAALRSGKMTAPQAAAILGCIPNTLRHRYQGQRPREGSLASDQHGAALYRLFMSGDNLKNLARAHNTTVGNIQQTILRYRRRHGLPCKVLRVDGWAATEKKGTQR